MYTDFYQLTGLPFQLTPDHRFFFDSRPHRKAMAYLSYGLSKGEGFIVITGEIGAGKTTLIDHLLETLHGKAVAASRVVTSQIGAEDLLALAARGFGIEDVGTRKARLLMQIEDRLVANQRAGLRSLLVIDEVQSLRDSALEELRMLSNFGLGAQSVLQICLVGQPEFRRTLAADRFEQLRQRVIASHHLFPLDLEESHSYIRHRLRHVGWTDDPSFADGVFARIHEETGGIPRRINVLCDRLLLLGYLEEKHELSVEDVEDVIMDMREELLGPVRAPPEVTAASAPTPAAAQDSELSDTEVSAIRQKLRELELLVPSTEASAPPPATAELAELDELLTRMATLKQQLKESPE